jgi:sulfite reductase beta subunit-like hemoprotein
MEKETQYLVDTWKTEEFPVKLESYMTKLKEARKNAKAKKNNRAKL